MTDPTARPAGASARAIFHGSASANALLRGPQVCYAPDGEGDGGGWSIEQAVAHLDAGEDHEDNTGAAGEPSAEGAAAAPGAAESEGAASAPEDAAGAAETQAGEGAEAEAEAGAVAPAEPPKYWPQDAKAKFAELPPELQAVVLAQEGPREAAAAKAKEEARQAVEQASQQLEGVQRLSEELSKFLPQAVQTFASRWGTEPPDWVAFAQQHGTEQMTLAKAQFEREAGELQRVAQATREAEQQAQTAYVQGEFERLKTLDPELADPDKGVERRTEVTKYLLGVGYTPTVLQNISASDMVIARKAMLWDQANAKAAKPNPPPKAPPPATRPLARGGTPAAPSDPKAKASQSARNRFVQTKSIADAAAWLDSLEE